MTPPTSPYGRGDGQPEHARAALEPFLTPFQGAANRAAARRAGCRSCRLPASESPVFIIPLSVQRFDVTEPLSAELPMTCRKNCLITPDLLSSPFCPKTQGRSSGPAFRPFQHKKYSRRSASVKLPRSHTRRFRRHNYHKPLQNRQLQCYALSWHVFRIRAACPRTAALFDRFFNQPPADLQKPHGSSWPRTAVGSRPPDAR